MNRFFFGVVITASMVLQLEDLHGQSNLESQKEAWVEASSDDSLYFERSLDYGWSLYYQGGVYLDTAKMVTFIARDLSEGLNNYISEIASYNLLGEIYRVGGMSDSAIYFSDLAIGIAEDNQDTLLRGKLLANKASIYINSGELDESLKLNLEAHDIFKELDDSVSIAISLQCLASVYIDKGEHQQAKPYALEAYDMYGRVFTEERQSFSATSLGSIYRKLGLLDSAEYYYLHTQEHGGNYQALWRDNESYLAKVYSSNNQYQKALNTLKSLISNSDLNTTDPRTQDHLARLTVAYIKTNELDSAEYVFDQIDFSKISDQFRLQLVAYDAGYQLMIAKGNYKGALENFEALTEVKDSVFNIESEQRFNEIQTKYETNKKEQEIELLNTRSELQLSRLTASRYTVVGLIIGLVLFGGLLYWLSRLNITIKKSRDEKDTLLREIHHRVKNNLQVISALLTLQSSHLKNAQAKSALQEGQDRVQSMALIHKDLYQHDNLKGVNTKDYLEQLIENLLQSYKIDESEVKLNLDIAEINIDVDTMIPMGLMVNELISNALKHAFKQSEDAVLEIKLSEQHDQLLMIIADNGKGVADIDGMKKKSFGYSLVQSFARKLDADLQIESSKGLKIDLTIKNYKKV